VDLHRSLLFIPAQKERWIAGAASTGADAVILDLADALPYDLKSETRRGIATSIKSVAAGGAPCFVRANTLASGMLLEDLEAAATAELAGVVLSEAQDPDEIRLIDQYLSDLERRRGLPDRRIELIIVAETAMAMYRPYEMCAASPRVGTIMGGTVRGGDINRAVGFVWSRAGMETLYLRSHIVLGARAAGITYPISGTWTDIDDLDGLRAHAQQNRQLGYRGEFVIHPSHVAVVNEVYSPGEDEIAYCRGVIETMAAAERAGSAGARYGGALIDYAHVRTAQQTLALVERLQGRARMKGES
jgi:citrate lyase subunit beta / citryl-CoA lyase